MKNKKIDLNFDHQDTISEESDESEQEQEQQNKENKTQSITSFVTSSDCKFLYYMGKMTFTAKIM